MASALEMMVWVVCLLLATAALGQTLPHRFGLQRLALGGEAIGAGFAVGLTLLALRRMGLFLVPTHRTPLETRWALLGIGLRICLGAPTLVTLIVVSAAGFTA